MEMEMEMEMEDGGRRMMKIRSGRGVVARKEDKRQSGDESLQVSLALIWVKGWQGGSVDWGNSLLFTRLGMAPNRALMT